jgi:leader peptidase (prepilin peptidase)/N-methyltransferase
MTPPIWLGSLIALMYGAVVGSFLNVCIYRLPAEQSVVNPPSHCPKCNEKLRARDLVPLFSFLMLGRKCRYCKTPISWRYFTVELITALLFFATFLRYGYSVDTLAYVLFISALLVAFFVDVDQMIIPDQVVIAGLLIGLAKDIAHIALGDAKLLHIPTSSDLSLPMLPSVAGAVVCAGVFYLIAYIGYFVFKPKGKPEGESEDEEEYGGALGGGDISLAAAMGAVMGMAPALISFFLAVVVGALFGIYLLLMRAKAEKKGIPWRTEIPFGPYMVTGAIAVLLLSPQLSMLWNAWAKFASGG